MNRYNINGNLIVLEPLRVEMLPTDIPIELAALSHIVRCFYNVRARVSPMNIPVLDAGRELVENLALISTESTTHESRALRAMSYVHFPHNLRLYLQTVIDTIGQDAKSVQCPIEGLHRPQQRRRIGLLAQQVEQVKGARQIISLKRLAQATKLGWGLHPETTPKQAYLIQALKLI